MTFETVGCLVALQSVVPPTEFEASEYPNRPGVRRYEKIVRFTTINAVKAGSLTKSKGTWAITEDGRKALAEFPEPEQFMREAVRPYRSWKLDQPEPTTIEATEFLDDATAMATATLAEALEAAWREIELPGADEPVRFQDVVAGLLRAMGYHVA